MFLVVVWFGVVWFALFGVLFSVGVVCLFCLIVLLWFGLVCFRDVCLVWFDLVCVVLIVLCDAWCEFVCCLF